MLSDQQYKLTKTCDFAFSKENFFYEHVAMAFPDDSPWIKKFNHEIRLMLQSGLMLKWKKTYWPAENECTSSARGGISSTAIVSVSDMQGSFFILLMGIVLSFIVLGFELCCSTGKGKRDNSVKQFTP